MDEYQHVAVIPFPFASHASSMFTFVRILASAAPNVKFSFISTPTSNISVFKNGGFSNIKPYNVWDGLHRAVVPSKNPTERIDYFLGAAPANLKKGIETAVAETGMKISCLVTDAFLWFAADMAEEMQVPWIPVWGSGSNSLSTHYHTDLLRRKIGVIDTINGNVEKSLDFIPGLSGIRVIDMPEGIVLGNSEGTMSRVLHYMGRVLPRATAIVLNAFEELDPIIHKDLKSKFKMILNVGFFTLISPPSPSSDEHGCLSWLDKQEPSSVAYVSFGSVIVPPPQEITALAEALEASGIPFLWSFRGNANELLPKGFIERTAERGKVVPWAPQMQILAHASTGAFLTHGGWNSITETITGGVPMICRPFFGDQKLNRRAVEKVWGVGVGVEGDVITKDGLLKALEMVFCREEGKNMKRNIERFKELAVKAAALNGTSSQNFKTLLEVVTKSKKVY